jgi:hypothetical protein
MTRSRWLASLLVAVGMIAGSAAAARASDPVGIYALLDAVEIDQAADPPTVRLTGVFALSYRGEGPYDMNGDGTPEGTGSHSALYQDPAAGYLWFACEPGKTATCLAEWEDLRKVVGTPRCAAFGDRYRTDPNPPAHVWSTQETADTPDTYPIAEGVAIVTEGTCVELLAARGLAPATQAPEATSTTALQPAPSLPTPEPVSSTSGGGGGPTPPATLAAIVVIALLGVTAMAVWRRGRD